METSKVDLIGENKFFVTLSGRRGKMVGKSLNGQVLLIIFEKTTTLNYYFAVLVRFYVDVDPLNICTK